MLTPVALVSSTTSFGVLETTFWTHLCMVMDSWCMDVMTSASQSSLTEHAGGSSPWLPGPRCTWSLGPAHLPCAASSAALHASLPSMEDQAMPVVSCMYISGSMSHPSSPSRRGGHGCLCQGLALGLGLGVAGLGGHRCGWWHHVLLILQFLHFQFHILQESSMCLFGARLVTGYHELHPFLVGPAPLGTTCPDAWAPNVTISEASSSSVRWSRFSRLPRSAWTWTIFRRWDSDMFRQRIPVEESERWQSDLLSPCFADHVDLVAGRWFLNFDRHEFHHHYVCYWLGGELDSGIFHGNWWVGIIPGYIWYVNWTMGVWFWQLAGWIRLWLRLHACPPFSLIGHERSLRSAASWPCGQFRTWPLLIWLNSWHQAETNLLEWAANALDLVSSGLSKVLVAQLICASRALISVIADQERGSTWHYCYLSVWGIQLARPMHDGLSTVAWFPKRKVMLQAHLVRPRLVSGSRLWISSGKWSLPMTVFDAPRSKMPWDPWVAKWGMCYIFIHPCTIRQAWKIGSETSRCFHRCLKPLLRLHGSYRFWRRLASGHSWTPRFAGVDGQLVDPWFYPH